MRRRVTTAGLAVASLLLLSGIGSTLAAAGGGTGGQLEGPTWILASYQADGGMTSVPAGIRADATFSDGTVHGSGACNRFSGPYTASGASLTIGQLATTLMACPEMQATVESAYYLDLARTATYTATADTLTIFDASGATLLTFDATKAMPTGTLAGPITWDLTAYGTGTQAVTSVIAGTAPTAVFGADGTVSGNATCNRYSGTYTTSGDTIHIGPLATTRMACADDAQQAQETAFLGALESAATYKVSAMTLELRDAAGTLRAEFTGRSTEPLPTTRPAVSPEPATGGEAAPYSGDAGSTGSATPPPTATTVDPPGSDAPLGALLFLAAGAAMAVAGLVARARTGTRR